MKYERHGVICLFGYISYIPKKSTKYRSGLEHDIHQTIQSPEDLKRPSSGLVLDWLCEWTWVIVHVCGISGVLVIVNNQLPLGHLQVAVGKFCHKWSGGKWREMETEQTGKKPCFSIGLHRWKGSWPCHTWMLKRETFTSLHPPRRINNISGGLGTVLRGIMN